MTTSNRGEFLLGLLIGAAAGAAAALLYAPAPGSETREQVKNAASDAVGKAGDMASTVKDRASDVASKAQDIASTVKDRATDMASKVTSQAQDLASSVPNLKDKAVNAVQGLAAQVTGSTGSQGGGPGQGSGQAPAGGQSGDGNASGNTGGDWAAQLPQAAGSETHPRMDQHTLQTSDDPDVVAERVNNAMQGSGEEAHDIAEELAEAPVGRRSEKVAPSLES